MFIRTKNKLRVKKEEDTVLNDCSRNHSFDNIWDN